MLESADACRVGLAAVSGDIVESTNYILKKGCNGHSSRGGGAGKSAVEGEAMVVRQVWEWWFLTFDLPLLHYNTPHTSYMWRKWVKKGSRWALQTLQDHFWKNTVLTHF